MEIKKPVENVLEETLKNLKDIIDVNLIVGSAINAGTATVIPVSKLSVGFVSGGGEYANSKKIKKILNFPFAGGSGGGCNITPIGFLVIDEGKVNFVNINDNTNFKKFIDLTTDVIDNLSMSKTSE